MVERGVDDYAHECLARDQSSSQAAARHPQLLHVGARHLNLRQRIDKPQAKMWLLLGRAKRLGRIAITRYLKRICVPLKPPTQVEKIGESPTVPL